jgi:hypothetical protein
MKNFIGNLLLSVTGVFPVGRLLTQVPDSELRRSWKSITESPIWARRRWLSLFGWPGMLGTVLLVLCLALYISAVQPAQVRLNEAHESAISVQERVKRASIGLNHGELTAADQLAEFYRIFPDEKNLLPWLQKVFALAQAQDIRLDQGEYKVTRDKIGKLMRFEMTLPVRSTYPQIRKYLDTLHKEIPIMAMEHLQFERQKVNDSEVEAKIKLALYVERTS